MKTMDILKKTGLVLCIMIGFGLQGNAQCKSCSFLKNVDLMVDWQVNAPVPGNFTDGLSGWGMNFELSYNVTPIWEIGAFASFHTNHGYVERQTLPLSPTESLTTDQLRSSFQVPFGLTTSFALFRNRYFRPYVGAKIGTMFNRNTTYYGEGGSYDKAWGFYAAPEIGLEIFPFKHSGIGFHIAGYYGYGTNKTMTLTQEINGQGNLGFRLGIIF